MTTNIDKETLLNSHMAMQEVLMEGHKIYGVIYVGDIHDQDIILKIESRDIKAHNDILNPATISELIALDTANIEMTVDHKPMDISSLR